jgi:hypothetical protein
MTLSRGEAKSVVRFFVDVYTEGLPSSIRAVVEIGRGGYFQEGKETVEMGYHYELPYLFCLLV